MAAIMAMRSSVSAAAGGGAGVGAVLLGAAGWGDGRIRGGAGAWDG